MYDVRKWEFIQLIPPNGNILTNAVSDLVRFVAVTQHIFTEYTLVIILQILI